MDSYQEYISQGARLFNQNLSTPLSALLSRDATRIAKSILPDDPLILILTFSVLAYIVFRVAMSVIRSIVRAVWAAFKLGLIIYVGLWIAGWWSGNGWVGTGKVGMGDRMGFEGGR